MTRDAIIAPCRFCGASTAVEHSSTTHPICGLCHEVSIELGRIGSASAERAWRDLCDMTDRTIDAYRASFVDDAAFGAYKCKRSCICCDNQITVERCHGLTSVIVDGAGYVGPKGVTMSIDLDVEDATSIAAAILGGVARSAYKRDGQTAWVTSLEDVARRATLVSDGRRPSRRVSK